MIVKLIISAADEDEETVSSHLVESEVDSVYLRQIY